MTNRKLASAYTMRPLSADMIERIVERRLDKLERNYLAGELTEEQYLAASAEIDAWEDAEYRLEIMEMTLPIIPPSTVHALENNGWKCGKRTADRTFPGGVKAVIRSDGSFYVEVNNTIRLKGQEPQHDTLEWTVCCTAMEANEHAWAQPEYKEAVHNT